MSVPPPYYQAPPAQPMRPEDERLWATLLHLSPFVVGFWGPLIGFLVLKDRGPFIRAHLVTALNFQISILIYSIALIPVTLVTFGIGAILYLPLAVLEIVFAIMAALAAHRGQWYSYPMTIRMVS